MNLEEEKVIGIVGGMGPQAGLALLNRVVCHTQAVTDQQHLSAILMSFPKHIADRTAFLEGAVSTNPAYTIAAIIGKLERAGARVAGIACNTAHAPRIYEVILAELARANSGVQLLNMPQETCRYLRENQLPVRRIGLMTTNGTYKAGVYTHWLREWGYEAIIPDYDFQNQIIHNMIYDPEYGIKSNPDKTTGRVNACVHKVFEFFKEKKADAVILGCTELSLVITGRKHGNMLLIDPTEILAKALIREATRDGSNASAGPPGSAAAMGEAGESARNGSRTTKYPR